MNDLNDTNVSNQIDHAPPLTTILKFTKASWIARVILACSFAIALSLPLIVVVFGSVGSFIRYTRGETLGFDELDKSFGDVTVGGNRTISFTLTNNSWSPIKILGCSVGCACTIPETLPMTVGPRETRPFRYTMRTSKTSKPEPLVLESILYTNNPRQREIHLTLSAILKARVPFPVGGPNP